MGNDSTSYLPASIVARQRLGLPLVGRIVLYVGRFAPDHPLDLLMDAVPHVMDRVRVVHFVLIGDGITRHRLEAIARARSLDAAVIFAGDVPPAEVTEYVVASDVGLHLSSAFGCTPGAFGMEELWPFMNVGRAVVGASDMPDARNFIQVNNIGCCTALSGRRGEDVQNLTLALGSMLQDDRARVRRAENARRLARQLGEDRSVLAFLKAAMRRAAAL